MSSAPTHPVIVAARRTPIGRLGGGLREVTASELAASVLGALRTDLGRAPAEVILGNCMGPGGDVARVAALAAGLDVPAVTVDRQCGSGLAAITMAVDQVRSRGGVVFAGGVESGSTQPWRFWPPSGESDPVRYERAPFAPPGHPDPEMGPAADALAVAYGIARADQDAYAARSHARAVATASRSGFAAELVPLAGLDHDERPSSRLDPDRLARLVPAFAPDGTATVGNSCGVNDGAAAVAVVDEATRRALDAPGLQVLATATATVSTDRPGLGLVPAVRAVLSETGLAVDDIEVIEFNEAFAGQILACCAELALDPERVCPEGGAIALGHPWGASGAVLVVRLFSQLVREPRAGAYGLAAIAVGGGQGVAMLVRSC